LLEDKREVELVWNCKTNNVCNVILPFQIIEQVDEPRTETNALPRLVGLDSRGRQKEGWNNKLIWGDNKLILSSLKNWREDANKAQNNVNFDFLFLDQATYQTSKFSIFNDLIHIFVKYK
jgi:hypothetical protein